MISDKDIREVIAHTPKTVLAWAIDEYIHDERNQEIARGKLIKNIKIEPLSEYYDLTPGQVKNILRKARRTIYEAIS